MKYRINFPPFTIMGTGAFMARGGTAGRVPVREMRESMAMTELPKNLMESPSEIARRFENKRAGISKEITKAEILMDQRLIVIWTSRFLDAWPSGKLSKIERAVKFVFEQKLKTAKFHLTGTCPVCGDHMHGTLCPDDITRPWCPTCCKAYTPIGYTSDDDYAKKWGVREYSRDKAESYTVIEVP